MVSGYEKICWDLSYVCQSMKSRAAVDIQGEWLATRFIQHRILGHFDGSSLSAVLLLFAIAFEVKN